MLGETCTSDDHCQAGLSCRTGTCKALAATGSPCLQSDDCSSIGDYCNGTTCAKLGVTGDACVSSSQCAQPFYTCDSATQMCSLGPRLGDSCATTDACVDKSYCDTQMTAKCVGASAPFISSRNFQSILQKPATAPTDNPSDARVNGGSA